MKNNKLLIGLVVVLVVFPLFFLPSVFKSSEEEQTYNDSSREEVVPTTEDETSGELVEDPNGEELGDEGEVIEGDTEHPATGSEAGGVASNSHLRESMKKACEDNNLKLYYPDPIYCTDNAAMIACAAYYDYLKGARSGLDLNAIPNLRLGQR